MKETPILFNAEMVNAILSGRKTQTRRVLKNQPTPSTTHEGYYWFPCKEVQSMVNINESMQPGCEGLLKSISPFGDKLWVRETFQGPLVDEHEIADYQAHPGKYKVPAYCQYKADGGNTPEFRNEEDQLVCRWRPSIHMPKWASRISLEITGVKIERLQDISNRDALNEGIPSTWGDWGGKPSEWALKSIGSEFGSPGSHPWDNRTSSENFKLLWVSIYGEKSWNDNHWVWVVEFERHE